jgi:HK97 family phage prohead protease
VTDRVPNPRTAVVASRSGVTPARPAATSQAQHDSLATLSGYFAVFDQWTSIWSPEGSVLERIAPTALDRSIREDRASMRVQFQHGHDPSIGQKVLGSIVALRSDRVGAYYEASLFDTSYNRDLLPGLRAGLYGASFRFRPTAFEIDEEPEESDHNPGGIPEVTITEARVREFGPVAFGAYPAASAVARDTAAERGIDADLFWFADTPAHLKERRYPWQQ